MPMKPALIVACSSASHLSANSMTHQAGTPLDLVDTEYSACSVATQPYGDRSLIATGLYQIVKDDSADGAQDASAPATKRLGRCLLSRIDGKGKLCVCSLCCMSSVLDPANEGAIGMQPRGAADRDGCDPGHGLVGASLCRLLFHPSAPFRPF